MIVLLDLTIEFTQLTATKSPCLDCIYRVSYVDWINNEVTHGCKNQENLNVNVPLHLIITCEGQQQHK